ncbi:hypothetical protein SAMN05421754_10695 [Nitrosomonas sp. Nm58]|nr:hypothetical protein SAMN05421754_10695 [Nitrosomonas sp. Nm58]
MGTSSSASASQGYATYEYTYAYATVCPLDGKFDSLVLPNVNTECMQISLDEIARRYPNENIVMVMDGVLTGIAAIR